MSMIEHRANRRNRRVAPVLETIEGRILLSSVPGTYLPDRAQLVAEAARARRLAISGKLNGSFTTTPQTIGGQQLILVTINASGNSGNRLVGLISLQTSFPLTPTQFNSLASTKGSLPLQNLQFTAHGDTLSANGTLSINAASRRSPFSVTASITGGTGQFANATGSLTLQGTSFSLTSMHLAGSFRGTIVTHT
jgi:hypothetical protein